MRDEKKEAREEEGMLIQVVKDRTELVCTVVRRKRHVNWISTDEKEFSGQRRRGTDSRQRGRHVQRPRGGTKWGSFRYQREV